MAQSRGLPARMMEAVDSVNEAQKNVLGRKILDHFGGSACGKTVAIWGLAFKPRTDDIREAPALVMIDALIAQGAEIRVHDPEAIVNVRALYGDRLVYCDRPYGALEQADALAIATEWNEFRNPDFEVMKRLMRARLSSSTAGICTIPSGWPNSASPTTASAAPRRTTTPIRVESRSGEWSREVESLVLIRSFIGYRTKPASQAGDLGGMGNY